MTHKEEAQACEALIRWLKSQDIHPSEAVPILALAMVTAVISVVAREAEEDAPNTDQTERMRRGIAAAAATVPEAYQKMRRDGVFKS